MKALKITGIIIAVLVLIIAILGVVVPKEYHVERSIEINAPKEVVFDNITSLKKIQAWSPWTEYDPDMKVTYEGEEGTVGSKSTWDGNEDVGKGEQLITAIDENGVDVQIKFLEPWEVICQSSVKMSETEQGVNVTWAFDGTNPFPWNVLGLFMNMDDALGADFEKGMQKLKSITEEIAANMPKEPVYEVKEETIPAKIYLAVKDTVLMKDMTKFYEDNFEALFQTIQMEGVEVNGAPSGLFYSWDEENHKTFMAAAVPVKVEPDYKVEGFETIVLDSAVVLHIPYMGAYDKSGGAHMAMDNYIKEHGMEQLTPMIEEYITDPGQEPDTSKWLTNIYYLVK